MTLTLFLLPISNRKQQLYGKNNNLASSYKEIIGFPKSLHFTFKFKSYKLQIDYDLPLEVLTMQLQHLKSPFSLEGKGLNGCAMSYTVQDLCRII